MYNRLPAFLPKTLLIAALACPITAVAMPFSGMFVFGDSLADSGNNAAAIDSGVLAPFGIPAGTRETTPIASDAFIPTPPYVSDRYSNGPVWVEQLAGALGVSAAPALVGGTNLAFGGARTGPVDPTVTAFPPSLLTQAALFLATAGGPIPGSALYVVNGGGNDLRDALDAVIGGADPVATALAAATTFAANIVSILTNLAAAGADNFLLTTVPNVGLTPAVQANGPLAAGLASQIATAMNGALFGALALQSPQLLDHLNILDLFALGSQVAADPAALGLTDVTTACAAHAACLADPSIASTTFFWDGIHPTTAGHKLIATAALRLLVPEPGMIALLFAGVAVVIVRRRSARA